MRRKLNKISVLFLAFIFLLTLLLGSIKVYAEDNTGKVYETLEEYLQENYSYYEKEEIEYLYIEGTIKDYTGLSSLTNLTSLTIYNNENLGGINLADIPKLQDIYIYECNLNGTLNFTKNKNLKDIYIHLVGDVSKAKFDIRGMSWINKFDYSYYSKTAIDFKKSVLMDDYNLLNSYDWRDEDGYINGNAYFYMYDSIELYLQKYYADTPREEIEELYVSGTIKDYTGLSTLKNLKSIDLVANNNLKGVNFFELPKLESVYISESKLKGTLDFSKNTKLTRITIYSDSELSDAVIDIRGTSLLKDFYYSYYDNTAVDLKKCILMDDYDTLETDYPWEDEDGKKHASSYFYIYDSIETYLQENYSDTPRDEIEDLYIEGTIKYYTGLSTLKNLNSLTLEANMNLNGINFAEVPKLEYVSLDGKSNGTLDFSKNTKLTDIEVTLKGDLSKSVVNIKGMNWLSDFDYEYYNATGFDLKKSILMDDYDILQHGYYNMDDDTIHYYRYHLDIYNNIGEFIEDRYFGQSKDKIDYIEIYSDDRIKDMSGINALTNLKYLYIEGQSLNGLNVGSLSKLETVEIVNCKLNGTIDLTNNKNLNNIQVNLYGDLSKSSINIKGLKNIETFKYEHYNSTGFNLKSCILADNYDSLERSTYKNNKGYTVEVYAVVKTLTQYLIQSGVDTNSDGKLSAEEWKKVKNLNLDCNKIGIKGIENAVNLKHLGLTNAKPNLIDFSKFKNLESLYLDTGNMKADLVFPEMSNLEILNIYGINNLDISKLPGIKEFHCTDIDGKITFPIFEKLEYIYCDIGNNKIDLSKCTNLDYSELYNITSIDNIKLPKDHYISFNGNYISIEKIEKEISIKKGGTYSLYTNKPTYSTNEVIEISSSNEYFHTILAKKVGTAKIKVVDDLNNMHEITIKVTDEKIDTKLDNTGVTAEQIDGEMILKSNGELWKINSETTAEKVDTNVEKYVWGYAYGKGDVPVDLQNTLKKDKTLTVKIGDTTKNKVASNVSDVNGNLYLTTSGDLYELGANYITEELSPKKVLSNVKKITQDCVVLKDGTTWYQEIVGGHYKAVDVTFKKLADFEIKDSRQISYQFGDSWEYIITVIDTKNNLWCTKSRSTIFDDSGLEKIKSNFEAYEEEFAGGQYLTFKNGKAVLETGEYNDETGEWEVTNTEVILTDVSQVGWTYWGSDLIIRTDGSIWLYNETSGLVKITKSTVVDEDKKEEKEDIPFTDVSENAWYYNAVKFNYEKGMIKGTSDTTFNPSGDLTRGMLVTILWRMEGNPKVTSNQFTDVGANQYYYNAVNWAASKKIISGYGNGKFGPNDKITREQLAVILRNYALYKKKNVSARTDLSKFTDNKNISSYAKDAVSWAVANKIISGKSEGTKVDPHGKATRAETAAMLYNYCMNIK